MTMDLSSHAILRPYRLGDHRVVMKLYEEAYGAVRWRSHYPPRPPLDAQTWGDHIREGRVDPLRTCLAEEDGLPIGVVAVTLLNTGERALPALAPVPGFWGNWESALWVTPDRRRRGVGRALVDRALEGLASEGYDRVVAFVFDENEAALALFEGAGFRRGNVRRYGERKVAYAMGFYVHALHHIPQVRRCDRTICRRLHDTDLDAVARFMARLNGKESTPTREEATRAYFHAAYEHFVAEREGEIVGTMCTWSNGELVIPGVLPALHGQGVGSALMHFTLTTMRDTGYPYATVASAIDLDGAHSLYARLGFENTRWLWLMERPLS